MKSIKECSSILNINFIQGGIFDSDPLWSNNLGEFKPSMHARLDILNWLTRVVINYTFPMSRDPHNPMRECIKPNALALFKSIEFLISLGYPKHWFRMFMQDLLNNGIVTVETFPSSSPNKHLPAIFDKNIDLTSILLELHILSSVYSPVLRLGILLSTKMTFKFYLQHNVFESQGLLTNMDMKTIRQYSIKVEFSPYADKMGNQFNDVLGLLLEEKCNERTFGFFGEASLRKELIEKPTKGKHLFSVFKFSSAKKLVLFMMCEKDFERMSKKDWHLSLIRTDSWASVTSPVKLSRAKLTEKQLID